MVFIKIVCVRLYARAIQIIVTLIFEHIRHANDTWALCGGAWLCGRELICSIWSGRVVVARSQCKHSIQIIYFFEAALKL